MRIPPIPRLIAPACVMVFVVASSAGARAEHEAAPFPASPRPPVKTGKYCLDEPKGKVALSQTLGGQVNPLGVEHQLVLSICVPFTQTPGVLFDFTNVELGLVNYLTPVYDHQGAFVSVTPLSFLKLRVEASGLRTWPIPLDGAGYSAFARYDDDFSEDVRKKKQSQSTTGGVIEVSGTLQGKAPLPGGNSLLITDTFIGGLWTVGDAPFYYNSRRDVVMARSDWLLKNTGAVLAEIPLTDNISVRVGAFDDMNYVPRSGYMTNILGGIATLFVKRVGAVVRNLQPFVRGGGFTSHASSTKFRTGEVNLIGGINLIYDLKTIDVADDEPPAPPAR